MDNFNSVIIYYHPHCSKSRATIAILKQHQIIPTIIYYLETPPDVGTLRKLIKLLGFHSARELIRTKEENYTTLGLANPSLTEAELLAAMTKHPILIERPIVVFQEKARIGRPSEQILEIIS